MANILRGVALVLVHTLHTVEVECAKAASLNLGDATLLVLDGMVDEGMEMAREMLGKAGTDVNLELETDDGSKCTPLAAAVHSLASPEAVDCMDLVKLLLAQKDINVNAILTGPDDSKVPLLVLAMKAVTAGSSIGVEVAKALLAHEKIAVNAMTSGGAVKLAPLHMALAAAARGAPGGMEVVGALLSRADIDADLEMVGPDGTTTTPLMKLASMLQEQPDDANLHKAIILLRGRAKPPADEEVKKLIDSVASKDEL